jgi:hypothetical protein
MTINGYKPWKHHLDLCASWLEIISDELALYGDQLSAKEAHDLCADAATAWKRAESLFKSLDELANKRGAS